MQSVCCVLLALFTVCGGYYLAGGVAQTTLGGLVGYLVIVEQYDHSYRLSVSVVDVSNVTQWRNSIYHEYGGVDVLVREDKIAFDSNRITDDLLMVYANEAILNLGMESSKPAVTIKGYNVSLAVKLSGWVSFLPGLKVPISDGRGFVLRGDDDFVGAEGKSLLVVQLSNNYQIVVYGDTMYMYTPKDKLVENKNFTLLVRETWTSPETGIVYPYRFAIILPEILLDIVPFIRDNEVVCDKKSVLYGVSGYVEGIFHGMKVLGTAIVVTYNS